MKKIIKLNTYTKHKIVIKFKCDNCGTIYISNQYREEDNDCDWPEIITICPSCKKISHCPHGISNNGTIDDPFY